MDKLLECREKIDRIDSEIIRLYEERMKVVNDVAEYKIANHMEVLDASREKAMLEKNLGKVKESKLKPYYHHVLSGFLLASREMQKDILEKK